MREEFGVPGKTVAAEKQGSFVDRRGRDGVNAAGRAQLNRRFDVSAGGFTSRSRFDTGFDKTGDVVEMIDNGLGVFRKRLVGAHDVVTGLQIESTRSVSE